MPTGWTTTDIPDQHGRTALVTGANTGIGFHQALELARKGAHVMLAARDPGRGRTARSAILGDLPAANVEPLGRTWPTWNRSGAWPTSSWTAARAWTC